MERRADPDKPDHLSRRPWLWSGVGLVVFGLLYVLVLFLYGNSTRLDVSDTSAGESTDPNAVTVILEISSVNALESTVTGTVQVLPGADVVDADSLTTRRIEVDLLTVNPNAAADAASTRVLYRSATVSFEKDRSALGLAAPITLRPEGNYQEYPFDVYRSQILAFVSLGDSRVPGEVPVNLSIVGDAPGWLIRDQAIRDDDGSDVMAELNSTGANTDGRFATALYLARAGSTKTFVVLLLAAMGVLAVTALLVARSVRLKRRRIEATMASWFAAMLFAVIPLRLNMPGSPPIGVWIDFVVLLWVELALMIGLAIFIGSWLRYTPRPDYAPPQTPAAAPEEAPASTTPA